MNVFRILLLPFAYLTLLAAAAQAEEPTTIRVGWIVPTSAIVFADKQLLKYDGKTYKLDLIHFRGSTPQINALATGDLDVALLGFTSLPLAVENAHLSNLRVIADATVDGAKGYASTGYFVRNGSDIKSVADLKGRVLAVNALGGSVDLALRIELLKHRIDPKTNVNIVEAPFPSMKAMLLGGKAALVAAVPPFSEDSGLTSKAHILFTQRDAMGGPSAQAVWVARKSFLDRHHAAVVDFLADYLSAMHFFVDPKNHTKTVAIDAKLSKLPAKELESWLFTHKDYDRPAYGVPNGKILQQNVDVLHRYGFLDQQIDVSKYVEPRFIEEAARRLN